MSGLKGTGALARLAIRRGRIGLAAYAFFLVMTVVGGASSLAKMYPTQAMRDELATTVNSGLAFKAFIGPLFASSIEGILAWRTGEFIYLLIAVMAILTVVRNTRGDEEAGRLELTGAGVVGRFAPLTASLIAAFGAASAIGLLSILGLTAVKLDPTGSIAFGLALVGVGCIFGAVAAVAAQLTASARTATTIAMGVLALSATLRFIGDGSQGGALASLSWLSFISWGQQVRPYADEQWWIFGLMAATVVALVIIAYLLQARRDLGSGFLAARSGRAEGSLAGPIALAWRQHRTLLIVWTLVSAITAIFFTSIARTLPTLAKSSPAVDAFLQRYGGQGGNMESAFLEAILLAVGLSTAIYPILVVLRMRSEETAGTGELMLSTPVSRSRWMASHLIFAGLGSLVLCAAVGVAGALSLTADDAVQSGNLLLAALLRTAPVWVIGGFAMLIFGAWPRLLLVACAIAWLVIAMFGEVIGPMMGIDYWTANRVSPFHYVPHVVSGGAVELAPILLLLLLAAVLTGSGAYLFRRRDLG